MKINSIKFQNFRIYKGVSDINFSPDSRRNVSVIAGRNGFGKTTFLTSLIWVFYGKMMVEVEDKYKKDIKSAGSYDNFLTTLLNRDIRIEFDKGEDVDPMVSIEIELIDLSIPSMPCNSITIRRTYNYKSKSEILEVFIDGIENELTKEVGYEVFINDFILPREIAKFFFFDAEKIVSLAEAKSKSELKNLSRAYSEVLGIKKYEDLRKHLEALLSKYKRDKATPEEQAKLQKLLDAKKEFDEIVKINSEKISNINLRLTENKNTSDDLQERLVREGNGISVKELEYLNAEQDRLKEESFEIKSKLKKILDLVPLVLAGKKLSELERQLKKENSYHTNSLANFSKTVEFTEFTSKLFDNLDNELFDEFAKLKIINSVKTTIEESKTKQVEGKVLLDFDIDQFRNFEAIYHNIKGAFALQFEAIVREEKLNRVALSKIQAKLKQAGARKDNQLAQKLRQEKIDVDGKSELLLEEKNNLIFEQGQLDTAIATNNRLLSEIENKIKLKNNDLKKFEVTSDLLDKISHIIKRIKEEKRYSLQKSIALGLKRIMHKKDFIHNVAVNVVDDYIDIELLDANNHIIDKDLLSKGEQQLYATALLKALVDESGIKFPVFIDSPLQKFDRHHSKNVIAEFYPQISEQVVLFPLLEKELSEAEYELLKPNVNKSFVIENIDGFSSIREISALQLFNKKQGDVYAD